MGKEFVKRWNMILVDVEECAGFSASLGLHYDDLYKLRDRKLRQNDFDCLLLMTYDRLCRGGTNEGNRIADDFEQAGIKIVTIREGLYEGDMAWLMRGMALHQANKYVLDLSFHVSAGWGRALAAKRITHSAVSPYGIDKLFLDSSGSPLYVVRDLGRGERVKLDLKGNVVEAYPKRSPGPIRQPTERIVYIKGEPERVAVVRQMFRRLHIDGWKLIAFARNLMIKGLLENIEDCGKRLRSGKS
jgi:hypothetical protein